MSRKKQSFYLLTNYPDTQKEIWLSGIIFFVKKNAKRKIYWGAKTFIQYEHADSMVYKWC